MPAGGRSTGRGRRRAGPPRRAARPRTPPRAAAGRAARPARRPGRAGAGPGRRVPPARSSGGGSAASASSSASTWRTTSIACPAPAESHRFGSRGWVVTAGGRGRSGAERAGVAAQQQPQLAGQLHRVVRVRARRRDRHQQAAFDQPAHRVGDRGWRVRAGGLDGRLPPSTAATVPTGGPAASRSSTARAAGGADSSVRRSRAGSAHSCAVAWSSWSAGRPRPAGYGEQTSSTLATRCRASSGPYSRNTLAQPGERRPGPAPPTPARRPGRAPRRPRSCRPPGCGSAGPRRGSAG